MGTAFDIGGGTASFAPYVDPSLVIGKAVTGEFETDWENDFGFTAGANLIVSNLLFGGAGPGMNSSSRTGIKLAAEAPAGDRV